MKLASSKNSKILIRQQNSGSKYKCSAQPIPKLKMLMVDISKCENIQKYPHKKKTNSFNSVVIVALRNKGKPFF